MPIDQIGIRNLNVAHLMVARMVTRKWQVFARFTPDFFPSNSKEVRCRSGAV